MDSRRSITQMSKKVSYRDRRERIPSDHEESKYSVQDMERRRRRNKAAVPVDMLKLNIKKPTSGENEEEEEFVKYGAVDEFYDLEDEIGRGAYATVQKCVRKETGHIFAVKTIKASNHNLRKDVEREIDVMRKLGKHNKLVQLHDAYQTPFEIAMVLEYIPGGELFERIVEEDYLMEDDAIYYVRQVLEALQYMHEKNIIHLDIKPENIMCVNKDSHDIKLVDFGLARELSGSEQVKSSFGTPDFVAPEVIRMKAVTTASDMWSVGVVTYVLLSGLMPFSGDDDHQTLVKVAKAEWDWDDDFFDDISEDAKEFIEGLLERDPSNRLTVEECLRHAWIKDKRINQAKIHTQKHRAFMARRRWKKSINALVAVRRISLSPMIGQAARRRSADPSFLSSTAEKSEEREQNTQRKISSPGSRNQSILENRRLNETRSATCIGLDMSTVRLLRDKMAKQKLKEEADKSTLALTTENRKEKPGDGKDAIEQNGSMHTVNRSPTCISDGEVCAIDRKEGTQMENSAQAVVHEHKNRSDETTTEIARNINKRVLDCINGDTLQENVLQVPKTSEACIGDSLGLEPAILEAESSSSESETVVKNVPSKAEMEKLKAVVSTSVCIESCNNEKSVPCSVTVHLDRSFISSDKLEHASSPHMNNNQPSLIVPPSINITPCIKDPSVMIGHKSSRGTDNAPDTTSPSLGGVTKTDKCINSTITVKLDQCSSLKVRVDQVSSHVRRASTGSPAIQFIIPINETM